MAWVYNENIAKREKNNGIFRRFWVKESLHSETKMAKMTKMTRKCSSIDHKVFINNRPKMLPLDIVACIVRLMSSHGSWACVPRTCKRQLP